MFKTALKFILFDKPKSIGALAGVVISVFLIGQQCGIFIFLTNAMSSLVKNNSQYIWVTDAKTTNVNALSAIDIRIGTELESVPGVKRVSPIVIAGGSAKFENGQSSGITLIGSEAPYFIGGPWNLSSGSKENMLADGAIITDYFDKKALGEAKQGDYFEVNGNKVYIAGQTKGVRGFGGPAYSFTTIERARSLSKFSKYKASAYLVQWDDNVTKEFAIRNIERHVHGVKAWDSSNFANQTILTVLKSSGIAISFGTLIVFALITGFVIIGLTLYSSAIDRIKDYGTLKAIGATNGYIRRLIVTQAMIIGVVGFIIGYALVTGFKNGIANAGTFFEYPNWLKATFLGITLFIALAGSLFAIRRITKLEPAQVFRG
ncbi:MAG: ABC transporter permease [Cytophagales bacterium]|nr:ABC transporter permease [Cytophaga sp.]